MESSVYINNFNFDNMVDITNKEPDTDITADSRQHTTASSSLAIVKDIASSSSESSSSLAFLTQLAVSGNNINNLDTARASVSDLPCSPALSQASNSALSSSSLSFGDTASSRECYSYVPSPLKFKKESVSGDSSSGKGLAGSERDSLDPLNKVLDDIATSVGGSKGIRSYDSGALMISHDSSYFSMSPLVTCGLVAVLVSPSWI